MTLNWPSSISCHKGKLVKDLLRRSYQDITSTKYSIYIACIGYTLLMSNLKGPVCSIKWHLAVRLYTSNNWIPLTSSFPTLSAKNVWKAVCRASETKVLQHVWHGNKNRMIFSLSTLYTYENMIINIVWHLCPEISHIGLYLRCTNFLELLLP